MSFLPRIWLAMREAGADMIGQLRENVRRFFAGEPLLSPVSAD